MKKKIGISFTKTNFKNYWDWFKASDLEEDIELIELNFEKNNSEDIYQCDGFVLTGGVDTHPSFYNGKTIYNNSPSTFQIERDYFEEKIYRYSQLNKLPVLGICRGMQLINVLEGGKLIQDLDNGNERHRKEESDKVHSIIAERSSLLHKVSGSMSGRVNSAHHQAIDPEGIGDNLMVNAYDDDEKIIEGLEFKNKAGKAFMLCVQWHPERIKNKEENPFSENLKKEFLSAIRKTTMQKLLVINPATEETITALNEDSIESLQKKMESLRMAQQDWQRVSLGERIVIIKKFSELLEKNSEPLAAILTSEVGKPLQQARNELNGARARIKWLTENAEKYLSDEVMSSRNEMVERISYEPLGVICNISAWNYPYLVGLNVFIPALLAGNSVMYKPSEYSTLTGLQIEKLLKQAGIPENVFQVAIGGKNVGELLLDVSFDGYYFTGSYKTGRYIYEKLAAKMVPCQCELGGKDPLYVAEDVKDIKATAVATADGAFYNNGQSCCAVERIYVNEQVYDKYIDEFIKEVKSWKVGSPVEEGVYIGPLSRKEQLNVLESQVAEAVKKGATVLTGGQKIDRKGYFFEPTVVVNVKNDMNIMQDESFGPLIGIMKVKDDDEAVRLMKDTAYGLTAAVYSADQERAENILRQINAGTGYWNCCDRVSAALPWSGRKHSGFGATLSHAGLRAFTKPKGYHLRKQ
ncbi:MAG TPA: aldehyde dehydrogenase family protein [Chitinophagaceae bacterium]|nr:aldehyde dehydrogenase family protein [Chitinophagaceae bacterium]